MVANVKSQNHLFIHVFKSLDLQGFVQDFNTLREGEMNSRALKRLRKLLLQRSHGLIKRGMCPVECMLYASKVVNNLINNNRNLQRKIATTLKSVYSQMQEESLVAFRHILQHWPWQEQIKIVLTTLGMLDDPELLLESSHFFQDPGLKKICFEAYMDHGGVQILETLVNDCLLDLQREVALDQEISRNFIRNCNYYFTEKELAKLEQYLQIPGCTSLGRTTIQRVAQVSETNRDYIFRLAIESRTNEDAYQELVRHIEEQTSLYKNYIFRAARLSRFQIVNHLLAVARTASLRPYQFSDLCLTLGILGGHQSYSFLVNQLPYTSSEAAVRIALLCMEDETQLAWLMQQLTQKPIRLQEQLINALFAVKKGRIVRMIQQSLAETVTRLSNAHNIAELECLILNIKVMLNRNLTKIFYQNSGFYDALLEVIKMYCLQPSDLAVRAQKILLEIVDDIHTNRESWHHILFQLRDMPGAVREVRIQAENILQSVGITRPM